MDPTADLVDALGQVAFVTMGALTRVSATHDLSLTQLRALGILRDRTLRMSELADYLGLERSTLSGLMARAAQRGLVSREPSPTDGRSIEVTLTDAGLALAATVESDVQEALRRLIAPLSPAQTRDLGVLVQTMLSQAS